MLALFLGCFNREQAKNFTRSKDIDFPDNELTEFHKTNYIEILNKSNLNLRYRYLPYIESTFEKIKIKDFQEKINIISTYDQNLFEILLRNNFEINSIINQYYTVSLDLRYEIKIDQEEFFFPTIIIMIGQEKIRPTRTSFIGVGLKISIRYSIFDKSGDEVAYCQKIISNFVYSNEFLSKIILEENSPFIKDLNEYKLENNNSILSQKIKSCEQELFNIKNPK